MTHRLIGRPVDKTHSVSTHLQKMIRKSAVLIVVMVSFARVYSDCTRKTDNRVTCRSITLLSGTYVKETWKNVDSITDFEVFNSGAPLDLSSSTFLTLTNLKNIVIRNSNLTTIYGGTFKNLPLTRIDLKYNEISKIAAKSFLHLNSVQTITLRSNKLEFIKSGVFIDMPIVTLTLSNNVISGIDDGAFGNLTSLKKLHLDNNKLTSAYPHQFLSNPEVLEILWLHNNSLKFVTANMLHKLTNLKTLNLGFNKIDTIEENAFMQTPNLDTLVLTHNNLKEVDGKVFPSTGMRSLQRLYLDHNKMMYISSNFFFRLINLKRITLMGNPWLCKCLAVIHRLLLENSIVEKCNGEFVSGNRPLCVADRVDSCLYVYDETLSDAFQAYQEENPIYIRNIDCIL